MEREFDRQTYTPNDWKDDTTSKQIAKQQRNLNLNTHKTADTNEGDIVNVMGDGYCMYRAIGKILQKNQVK